MNDKIKGLVEQAILDVDIVYEDNILNEELAKMYIPNCFAEKFAELIAKEILNISDEVITLSDSPEWLICERLGINHDWRRQDNFWS
jgi:hypothetical protein